MRPILTITGPQAKKIYETLNEPGDEKRKHNFISE